MKASSTDYALDHRLARRRFGVSAPHKRPLAVLEDEVARRMSERLDYIRIAPDQILDIGCGSGGDLHALGERYPQARRVGIDFALPFLKADGDEPGLLARLFASRRKRAAAPMLACAEAGALPFAPGRFGLIWSNLMLNWLTDPLPALREMHRTLAIDGLLMFSSLGPDTLKELRMALGDQTGARVHRFIDMHDIGDALVKAGFSDPVMDMEIVTLTYPDIDTLLTDLRQSGWSNASTLRPRSLSGKSGWAIARKRLEDAFVGQRLPITFEIIQGHAWKAAPRKLDDGRAIVRFQSRKPS